METTTEPTKAELLRSLRVRRQLTFKQLSGATGISTATLCRYEQGLEIGTDHAHLLAAFYRIRVSRLWTPPTLPEVS